MKKDNYIKIILIIIMVNLCLLSGYLVIKSFKSDSNSNDDVEEINLGAKEAYITEPNGNTATIAPNKKCWYYSSSSQDCYETDVVSTSTCTGPTYYGTKQSCLDAKQPSSSSSSSSSSSCTITGGSSYTYKSSGDSWATFTLSQGCDINNVTTSCTNCTITKAGNYTYGVNAGTTTCSGATATISVGSVSKSITINKIVGTWNGPHSGEWSGSNTPTSANGADSGGNCAYYVTGSKNASGNFTQRYTRDCCGGSTGGSTPPPTPTPTIGPPESPTPTPEITVTSTPEITVTPTPEVTATPEPTPSPTPTPEPEYCYCDEAFFGIAEKCDMYTASSAPSGYFKYGNLSSSECKTTSKPKVCTESSNLNPDVQDKVASKCEDTVEIKVAIEDKKCSSGSDFYTFKCETQAFTDFDYMGDGVVTSEKKLYNGQGFRFVVGVKTVLACKGTFNSSAWVSTFNAAKNKLATVKSSSLSGTAYTAYATKNKATFDDYVTKLKEKEKGKITKNTVSRIYELYRLLESIEGIVTTYNKKYNDIQNKNDFGESASLSMSYDLTNSQNQLTYTGNFTSTKQNCYESKDVSKTHTTVKNTASWLTSPVDYVYKNQVLVYLYPEEDSKYGGNKIYIDSNAEAQTISPITITVSNLAGNSSTVTNDKCEIEIINKDLRYRPIEVKNPFINKDWKKGDNWYNTIYDFTSVIHANTWSGSSLYTIDLTPEDIATIKESNKNRIKANSSPYIGLCDEDNTLWDKGTQIICKQIK